MASNRPRSALRAPRRCWRSGAGPAPWRSWSGSSPLSCSWPCWWACG